jgi:hypothetical protein
MPNQPSEPRLRDEKAALARSAASRRLALIAAGLGALAWLGSNAAASAERPDFSGVWGTYREPGADRGFRRGPTWSDLPLTSAARDKLEAYHALVDPTSDQPGAYCLGYGMPSAMLLSGGYPMQVVQTDDLMLVVFEAYEEVRWIYLKNRVKETDLFPERDGYSFGHWEGDKLVVETTHLTESLDQRQFPHGDQARIVEEYELTSTSDGRQVLVAQMTMTDPEFYTKPVTAEKKWQLRPDARLLPYQCNEPSWEKHLQELREQAENRPDPGQ